MPAAKMAAPVIMTVATNIPFDAFDLLMLALMFRQLPIELCNFFLKVNQ